MQPVYERKIDIRWSDLDPNYHVRHSAYYDYGAYCRVSFLNEHGITSALMLEQQIGPILFREECVFRREIKFADDITINVKLSTARKDMSRWTMVHELWKAHDKLCAVITVDGAWIDTSRRKLVQPPDFFREAMEKVAKTEGFEYI